MDYFFSAQGRIGRRTYIFRRMGIFLGYFLVCLAGSRVIDFMGTDPDRLAPVLAMMVLVIPFAVADVMQGIKRSHDLNRSGWYVTLTYVPMLGWLPAVQLMFLEGTAGDNRFGARPDQYENLTGLAATERRLVI